MSLSIEDFIYQVEMEIEKRVETYSYTENSTNLAFAQWVLELLFPRLDPDEAFNSLSFESSDGGVAHYKDDDNGTFYIIQTHFASNPIDKIYGQSTVHRLIETRQTLLSYEPEDDRSVIANEAHEASNDGYSIVGVLVLFGRLDSTVNLGRIRADADLETNELILYDLDELRRISAGWESETVGKEIMLTFVSSVSTYPGQIAAVVGSVSAAEFKKEIKSHVPYIYDTNLRVPLGTTKINREMEKTLQSDQSEMFWYFNNGITMLCKSFEFASDDRSAVTIEEPRIVNGAQTTDALIHTDFEGNADVAVMLRLIAAIPGSTQTKTEETREISFLQDVCLDIAKYTNSQNPVQIPDFRSNEDIQKRLHEKFAGLNWFYEHRRGQWANEDNKQQYRGANGNVQKLTMVQLAQEWLAFDGEPALAIREKFTLFEAKGKYGKIFMKIRSAEEYLVAHLLFTQIEAQVKEHLKKAKAEEKNTSQAISVTSRYYLAIGRATRRVAAHMTALIGVVVKEQYGDDKLNPDLAKKLLPIIESGELITNSYPDLQDTLFRLIDRLAKDAEDSLHSYLSNDRALRQIKKDIFDLVVEMEQARGRKVFLMNLKL